MVKGHSEQCEKDNGVYVSADINKLPASVLPQLSLSLCLSLPVCVCVYSRSWSYIGVPFLLRHVTPFLPQVGTHILYVSTHVTY